MLGRQHRLAVAAALAAGLLGLTASAAQAAVTASSSMGSLFGNPPERMVDGDLNTFYWSDRAVSNGDWVRVDLGVVQTINRVELLMAKADRPQDFIQQGVLETSSNGTSWSSLGGFSATAEVRVTPPAGTRARYVRARATAGQSAWLVVRELRITVPPRPSPPGQPTSGPAGSDYPHGDWSVGQGGSGNDAWYVFQPASPRPATAPVAIMLHGYGEYAGHNSMYAFIRHTVRKGYVVVYPRWQTGLANPGPIMSLTLPAATNGVRAALNWLRADPSRVQPDLSRVGYFGFSFGGLIAANMANRHVSLGTPVPKAVYLYEPFGGAAGDQLDTSMTGIPAATKLVCHVSDNFTETTRGCFALWPKLGHIANANKDFVTSYDDAYGEPALVAEHESICSPPPGAPPSDACSAPSVTTNAMDFFAHWKQWIALQSCANAGTQCEFGLNDTAQHRSMGSWSDGTPVRPLRIADAALAP